MNTFYIPEISTNKLHLSIEESKHCIKVLRLQKGDPVFLIDGKGSLYDAIIQVPDPKSCLLEIVNQLKFQSRQSYCLTIAIAPTKNMERLEWFLEKSTEIGIDRIIPIICHRSERKELKVERLEKILVSAMKQSGQKFLPKLSSAVFFNELVSRPMDGDKFIAHCEKGEKKRLKDSIVCGNDVTILIGPEGDFDTSEVNLAFKNGFLPVSLGDSILRTETAGVVACNTVSLVNGIGSNDDPNTIKPS